MLNCKCEEKLLETRKVLLQWRGQGEDSTARESGIMKSVKEKRK